MTLTFPNLTVRGETTVEQLIDDADHLIGGIRFTLDEMGDDVTSVDVKQ
jgi:hypothetical protein